MDTCLGIERSCEEENILDLGTFSSCSPISGANKLIPVNTGFIEAFFLLVKATGNIFYRILNPELIHSRNSISAPYIRPEPVAPIRLRISPLPTHPHILVGLPHTHHHLHGPTCHPARGPMQAGYEHACGVLEKCVLNNNLHFTDT
jgi:hypothetical protein